MHPFERAGLGHAPFQCVGVDYRVGPIRQMVDFGNGPVECEVGAPGQPMGTCAYCGQGIAECCVIVDATGKRFIVGSTCVGKAEKEYVGDGKSRLDAQRRKAVKEAKLERERSAILELQWRVRNDADLRAALAAEPHPNGHYASIGRTLLDWAEFMTRDTRGSVSWLQRVRRTITKYQTKD